MFVHYTRAVFTGLQSEVLEATEAVGDALDSLNFVIGSFNWTVGITVDEAVENFFTMSTKRATCVFHSAS